MRQIVHNKHGSPEDVLTLLEVPTIFVAPPGHALVLVRFAAVHPGDLLGIRASPAFGDPPVIPPNGRVPGWEGVGTILDLAKDAEGRFSVGDRVAFFPVAGTWQDAVLAAFASLVLVPDDVPDEVAAQMLINTATAMTALRAGHNSLPPDKMENVTVIQTGAASAVGRLLTRLLIGVGVTPIRLTRSLPSAEALTADLPEYPVLTTSEPHLREWLKTAIGGREIWAAFDSVGGAFFHEIASVVQEGGTIINYGSLAGDRTDIRAIVPRRLRIVGVTVGIWATLEEETRRRDVRAATDLATRVPGEFRVAGIFKPEDHRAAMRAASKDTRAGTVLLEFSAGG